MNKKRITIEEKVFTETENQRALELYGKKVSELTYNQLAKLDQYIYDYNHPIWKQVIHEGVATTYRISNSGKLLNTKTGRVIKYSLNNRGYCTAVLHYNSDSHPVRIHRLVAEAFIPNPENKPQVNHISGVKTCNWVGNLEWNTNAENINHAIRMGLFVPAKGVDCYKAEHTEEQVRQACELLEKNATIKEAAEALGTTRAFIIGIKDGNWKDIVKQYNIPKGAYTYKSPETIRLIDELLDQGIRNRREILSRVGLEYNKTNVSYLKYRIKLKNIESVKSSTTIPSGSTT